MDRPSHITEEAWKEAIKRRPIEWNYRIPFPESQLEVIALAFQDGCEKGKKDGN